MPTGLEYFGFLNTKFRWTFIAGRSIRAVFFTSWHSFGRCCAVGTEEKAVL